MNIVIGSGPAGIACASALLELGAEVTLLDVGLACEPETLEVVEGLRAHEPKEWIPAAVARISSQTSADRSLSEKFPLKLVYGSAFPYVTQERAGIRQSDVHCLVSWAKGGLSNVWGAAMLPFRAEDTRDWPFPVSALGEHYAAVSRMTSLAGHHDRLERDFPFFAPPETGVDTSQQARWLLERFESHGSNLEEARLRFGRSRLAIRGSSGDAADRCRACGLCLTGCPYGSIYCTTRTLESLLENPRFTYVPGQVALACERTGAGKIDVICRPVSAKTSSDSRRFTATRVFVAAGVVSTAKIILRSLRKTEAELRMQYHPYFLLPMLMLNSVPRVTEERLHTLAQIFLEIDDRAVSRHLAHLQIYTYNPMIRERVESALGFLPGRLGKAVRDHVLGHLVAVQGYLHSGEAEPIRVRAFTPEGAGGELALELSGQLGSGPRQVMRRIARKLRRNFWALGMIPIPFTLAPGSPGDGNHIGGTFPMSATPKGFETDLLGQLPELRDIHIVDASVFPALPATTLTFTAMANARRIAIETLKKERG